ncbi:MAG TPA: CBS domain-containing protein [Kofleriaceae bacterium]|nr:CBS domain-containing protein [Kofleriaceae bacterium]
MTRNVVTCEPTDSLALAAQRMWDGDCGSLPIVDRDGTLVGILTDRDICMAAWSRGQLLDSIRIDDVMSKVVFTVKPDDDISLVETVMSEKQVRRIPVVDASYKPIGILSMNDLAREAAHSKSKLRDGVSRAARTLAAVCRPRKSAQRAA